MNCGNWISELVECARRGSGPGAGLENHLVKCPRCQERWEAEQALTSQFRLLRAAASLRPAPDVRKAAILREFAETHRRARRPALNWALGLSATAVLALTFALGYVWLERSRTPAPLTTAHRSPAVTQAKAEPPETLDSDAVSDDGGFVPVPYAPPLATGEFLRVVRTELRPAALARMGVDVDVTGAGEISADVVVGEDGLPRAVRVVDEILF